MSHDAPRTSPYRKVSISTWADEKVRSLTPIPPSGQSLFLMLLVGQQTTSMPGVQPVGRMALAEMLDWSLEDFDKAFQEVSSVGLAIADWKARFLFIPKAIQHNLPQSPNVVKSWCATWANVPECELKTLAWHTIHDALSRLGKSFADAFKAACPMGSSEPLAKPRPKLPAKASEKPTDNQEQEQKQEQEQINVQHLTEAGVDRQHATDWIKARKAKRLPLTKTALDAVMREAGKAGLSLPEAIKRAAEEGWAGFKADWLTKEQKAPAADDFASRDYGMGGRL